ncbi:hypothetical protein [Actinacidiphila glaucinigra]|uniref:hypothetical protein n=1 Tax=Actinacidiphila glaucinigra TaxID=235986 RepID=UPI0036E7653C
MSGPGVAGTEADGEAEAAGVRGRVGLGMTLAAGVVPVLPGAAVAVAEAVARPPVAEGLTSAAATTVGAAAGRAAGTGA